MKPSLKKLTVLTAAAVVSASLAGEAVPAAEQSLIYVSPVSDEEAESASASDLSSDSSEDAGLLFISPAAAEESDSASEADSAEEERLILTGASASEDSEEDAETEESLLFITPSSAENADSADDAEEADAEESAESAEEAETAVISCSPVLEENTTAVLSAEAETITASVHEVSRELASADSETEEESSESEADEEKAEEKEAAEDSEAEETAEEEEENDALSALGLSSDARLAVTEEELNLLAGIIYCEAGGEEWSGQVAVGAVVLNRVESASFQNTIVEVVYAAGQFTPAMTGLLDQVLADGSYASCLEAARAALNGENPVGGCLYFNSGSGQGIQIGNQHFY